MKIEDLEQLLMKLLQLPKETEWIEFKVNYYEPQEIGEYISALSNSACLRQKEKGYLIFGIEDETHDVKGTNFKPKQKKIGNEGLESWLTQLLSPRVDFVIHEFKYDNKPIVLFEIDPARNQPVNFKGEGYIRVGDSKRRLRNYPEKERKIWKGEAAFDWSAQICKNATMDNLDPQAIHKARYLYKQKYPRLEKDIDKWDDIEFLNKARITRQSKITNSAIILLGKEESEHFISPSVAKICWILKDQDNIEKDYEHFGPPFLLNVDRLFRRLRNLKYRYLPDNTLFPIEINQYDPWVIREALHNCIAHQDYTLNGRINIIEVEDELIFSNLGSFIPGSVEAVIQSDAPPEFYRNYFLTQAMFNLDLIDTIGSGIRRMFQKQKGRFFPLPDYEL